MIIADAELCGKGIAVALEAAEALSHLKQSVDAAQNYPTDFCSPTCDFKSEVDSLCAIIDSLDDKDLTEKFESSQTNMQNYFNSTGALNAFNSGLTSIDIDVYMDKISSGESKYINLGMNGLSAYMQRETLDVYLSYYEEKKNSPEGLSAEELAEYNDLLAYSQQLDSGIEGIDYTIEHSTNLDNLMDKREKNNGWFNPFKEQELDVKIYEEEKALGKETNWFKDLVYSENKINTEWREGVVSLFKGEGFKELGDAAKVAVTTRAVQATSAVSGVAKLEEYIVDGAVAAIGYTVGGVTYLFDQDAGNAIMDGTLDTVRVDMTGEINEAFYEGTVVGELINENSALKYDSAGAQAIQNSAEFTTKVVLATACTVATGGAAAPLVVGALYGSGKAAENYAQSVDRENGEGYNQGEAALRMLAGGTAGAAEFYGYGQMGAGVLGFNVSPQASTTFAKNFFTTDLVTDTIAVTSDHAVNVILGDESWQDALLYGGGEMAFSLVLNSAGAKQATKIASKANVDGLIDVPIGFDEFDLSKVQPAVANMEDVPIGFDEFDISKVQPAVVNMEDVPIGFDEFDISKLHPSVANINKSTSIRYYEYDDFLDHYSVKRKNFENKLTPREKQLFSNYCKEDCTLEGNYIGVNGAARKNMVNIEANTITVKGSNGAPRTLTFDEFEDEFNISVESYVEKQTNAGIELNEAISRFELDEDTILYRGVNYDSLEVYGIKPGDSPEMMLKKIQETGDVYIDDGFMSTAVIPASITDNKPIVFELDCKAGTKGALAESFNPYSENEVLLSGGQTFKINGVRVEKNSYNQDIIVIEMGNKF